VEIDQQKAIISGHYKLLRDDIRGFRELYDLARDPTESKNLLGQQPKKAASLQAMLERWSSRRRAGERGESDTEALFARARKRDPGAIPGLVRLSSGSGEQRREAIRLLSALRARTAKKVLVRATSDSDPGVRIQATIGAALLGDGKSLAKVRALLGRDDLPPALRRDALIALAKNGDRSVAVALSDVLDKASDIYERIELLEVLGRLGDRRAALAVRRQLKTLRTRRYAISALGNLAARSAVPELISILRTDRFISLRVNAAYALGQIGDRRAIRDLQQVARREMEANVVARALRSLQRLDGLPIPGLRALSAPRWRCVGDVCHVDLDAQCGEAHELLLLLEPKPSPVAIQCGGKELGRVDVASAPKRDKDGVALEPVPAGLFSLAKGRGRLSLQTTVVAPAIRYAGLRPIPK
jgi:HEAT repeat protein